MIKYIILQTALIFPETLSEKRLQHSIKIGAITIDYYEKELATYMQQFSRCWWFYPSKFTNNKYRNWYKQWQNSRFNQRNHFQIHLIDNSLGSQVLPIVLLSFSVFCFHGGATIWFTYGGDQTHCISRWIHRVRSLRDYTLLVFIFYYY